MTEPRVIPNPDLAVGADNKQRWNRSAHRRHGFHNAHLLFRRAFMVRARHVLALEDAPQIQHPDIDWLCSRPEFSALVCMQGSRILVERSAPDFGVDRPHSIQSVTKLHLHLIAGRLIGAGLIDPSRQVRAYLPWIGTGYASAEVQDLLDMNIANDFSEDYSDPSSDCYTEELALGWRLPADGAPEPSLAAFAAGLTGGDLVNRTGYADYKSANTDVLTLICAAVSPISMLAQIEAVADAAGYEGALHISLSPEHLPALSGGGCLSARDLARFGLLLARNGRDIHGCVFGNTAFLARSLGRTAPALRPPKDVLRYSNHLMTDGRLIAHAGYGGQFLIVDTQRGISCAFLSVLENDEGYDEQYMADVFTALSRFCTG